MTLAVVQHNANYFSHGTPGSGTLGSTPTVGNLIIAFLAVNTTENAMTIGTGWTVFDKALDDGTNGTQVLIGLYRYVQSGDTTTLPVFCSAGTTYSAYTVYEISGVSGTWSTDMLSSMSRFTTSTGSFSGPYSTTVANGSLALTGLGSYNASSNASIGGSWTTDENHNNSSNYGGFSSASQTGIASGTKVNAVWTVASSGNPTGIIQLILTTAQPTTPYVRRARSFSPGGGSTTPGQIKMGGTPIVGDLFIAFLNWSHGNNAAPTISTNWTQFDQALNGSDPMIIGLYRYVQGGDSDPIPTLCTSGSTFWSIVVFEISGVTGTWASDFVDSKNGYQGSGSSMTTTSDTTASNNTLALLDAVNYSATALVSLTNFDFVTNVLDNTRYGAWQGAQDIVASSGSSVSSVITAGSSGEPSAYMQILLSGAGSGGGSSTSTNVVIIHF